MMERKMDVCLEILGWGFLAGRAHAARIQLPCTMSFTKADGLTRRVVTACRARNERIEQLQDDIADMKRIFHEQLNVCVNQLAAARSEIDQLKAASENSKHP